ncbi:hypothetical protein ACFUCV_12045 [Specibacter sp. NPDC057265]|uniref:hypothetical protein n=1 Tax=Specibacter sp. NPDC057265 TaxID=3346075 RepID=UPI0036281EC4
MVAVVVIALTAAALGAVAWAITQHRNTLGALLPAGAAVAVAMVVWITTMALGLGQHAATQWIPWIAGIAAAGAAAWTTAALVGRHRHQEYLRRSGQILQMR